VTCSNLLLFLLTHQTRCVSIDGIH
jgi:hypothetical protein